MRLRLFFPGFAALIAASCLAPYEKSGEGYACTSTADCRSPLVCASGPGVCVRSDGGVTATPPRLVVAEFIGAYPYFWTLGAPSHEVPSAGRYNASDPAILKGQLEAFAWAHIKYGAFQWYGPTSAAEADFTATLDASRDSGVAWVAFYKAEWASGAKSAAEITAVLNRVSSRFAIGGPSTYLHLDGGPALFVDLAFNVDACEAIGRWSNVASDAGSTVRFVFHAVGDVIANPGRCAAQPWAWYADSTSNGSVRTTAITTLMPGYWANDEASPRLARDAARFRTQLGQWVDGGQPVLFLNSFNSWLDGSALESSDTWKSDSGFGVYLDALHEQLSP